jgi:hypothetical protein
MEQEDALWDLTSNMIDKGAILFIPPQPFPLAKTVSGSMELIDWKPYSAFKSVTPWSSGWWGRERDTSMASIAENELSILLAS